MQVADTIEFEHLLEIFDSLKWINKASIVLFIQTDSQGIDREISSS